MENLPHPKDLDFNQENLAAAWKKWKKEFNLFLIATESDMKPDKVKTSMFLTCIGSKGRDIHSTLDFDSPDEEMNLQTVIEKFDAYCEPRKNITFLRHKFFTCGQAEHQKFDEYVVELRQKAQQCEFGNLTDSLTKDILICGIRDMRLRERLLREPNLDLQKTIQAGQSAEQIRLQSRMLNATSETRDNEISRVYSQHDIKGAKTQITRHMQSRHQNEQGGSDRKPAKFQAPSQHYVTNCHYCGYNHKRNKCPAFHKTCEKCKKQGHYAKMCKSRKFVHKVEIHTDDESDDDTHALEMITANNSRVHKIEKFKTPKDIWTVELKVNNSNVTFKIDTGADDIVQCFLHLVKPTFQFHLHQVIEERIQNDLIEAIHKVMQKEIDQAKFVSILVDVTSDVSASSQLSTVLRYVTEDCVTKERFISFSDVSADRSANALFEHVFKCIETWECGNKLIEQTYDGAATMAGQLNGLQAKSKSHDIVYCKQQIDKTRTVLENKLDNFSVFYDRFTMEDQTENTLRKLIPQKWALSYSTPKWDEEGVDHQRCKYVRDDGSGREMSEKRASSQPTTKQKRHQGDPKNWEIIRKRDVFDKHILYTRFNACEDKMNLLINSRKEICTFLKSIGMDENTFLKHFTQRIEILTKDIKKNDYNQEFIIFGKLELFLEHYIQRNILQDKHKTIEAPKIITKFRPLQPVVTREANIEESGEEFEEIPIISNIVIIEEGVMTYSHNCKIISLVTRDSDRIDVHCPSSVTSFTRISEDMVLATLPFHEMILIISPKTFKIKRIQLGLHMVSYLEDSTLIGVEMFGFLVFYRESKEFQCITYPGLMKGPLMKVHTDYIKLCHVVSNKCLALTTSGNKSEVHILLIHKDKVDIAERISLGDHNVSIAATPINFVVVDGSENKMVFYSTCGEELFQKYLPFYGYPHHIYSDNVYFYVLFRRHSILRCYDLYGQMKWQWELPFPVHPHIAVFQGTLYVPDTQLNRVLLYKYQDRSSGCRLPTKSPYIRNLNLRLKEKENDQKLVIGEICNLSNGQLVVSDINHDYLLYISEEGDIVSRLSLPSTATDICRWDSNHIGVTLPLQKQLRVIGNLSKTVRSVSLRQPYVRVCKMGEGEIVCYCDKPSHLDILAINYYNQVEVIKTINIPVFVKSLSIDKKTEKLLIVTRGKAFQYNTRIGGGGHGSRQMVPSVLMSQVKRPLSLQCGSIDQTSVYLIDRSRMFAINDQNLLVNDLVTNNQLNYYIDLVDVFSRHISLSEMLSSTLYLQDLTVSDKARHIPLPEHLEDKEPAKIESLVLTENNLIAGWDERNGNIKTFTLDGHLLDSIKVNVYRYIKMCRWQSNTLVITNWDPEDDNKHQLLTLKVEFPLSWVIYQTRNNYECVASFSNNQLVFSERRDGRHLHFVDIDEIHSSVKEIKQIDIPEPLIKRREDGNYFDTIQDIKVTDEDVIIVFNERFIIFFNSGGQYLHSVRHYMQYFGGVDRMTIDDSFLYIHGRWEKYLGSFGYRNILCLTQNGEYERIFLNKRIYKDEVNISSIDCKGPRFVGSSRKGMRWNELYVEGLFMVNRDSFPVARLQTDECPVQVKDFDVSEEGKTVVCEKANNGNVKIFDEDGQLLCHRNVASLVGGVCFTQESHIMATVPKRKEIFQLNGEDLQTSQVWSSLIPYGVIWRKVAGIYWCVHNELIECHCIKIDGDQVNILESVSLLNLDSGLRFPSITSETNKEIFSNELINKLEYRGGDGDGGGRRRGKSGEIIGKGRLKVRCGNYIAEINNSGIDEISVRRLPYRTAMVPFSIPAIEEPVDYDCGDIRDRNSKLIKLDENVSVLMFRESVTLIRTTTTTTVDILQHEQQQRPPLDICRWTEECFIVTFGREMRVFNRDLRRLKTIRTEKYYNRIYKYNDNQLVCGGHYIRDITQEERDKKYQRIWANNKYYYICNDSYIFDPYYVDVVDIKDGKCKDEVCRGKVGRRGRLEGDEGVVEDVGVTSFGDVVVLRREMEEKESGDWDVLCFVEWFREKSLVRKIRIEEEIFINPEYYIARPRLTIIGECVYITDLINNIYEIPRHIEEETSEDIEILRSKDNSKYLLLRGDDNEVDEVLGLDVSDNSLMVFGIIPGRQSFAFFYFDK
ncbi:Hypothetical predicted protein [Octopus vulgaris]|uniref:DUF4371 domain-containing protein n=1 Tax=Octopus vulgaris TaxID=6645 RepID=A0AA36BZM4_OCTVU|nr:Hypothetical predicted protein [Octopus vulgaris]